LQVPADMAYRRSQHAPHRTRSWRNILRWFAEQHSRHMPGGGAEK